MASMKLGSKPESFNLDGQTWICTTGLPSDVIIDVGETSFHLHKFPLLSKSGVLEDLIGDSFGEDGKNCHLQLHGIPGGAKTFLLVAKFCYGIKIELTAANVVNLRCAAEYLRMNVHFGEENLVTQTENFLEHVFGSWADSIKALETCEEVLSLAEELHIVSRCINSLAMKACADPNLFSWPVSGRSAAQSLEDTVIWNGIRTSTKSLPVGHDWWYEDVCFLRLPLYRSLILNVEARGMKPERITGSLIFYAKTHLPMSGRHSGIQNGNHADPRAAVSSPLDADKRFLLEEIVKLLPDKKGVTPTNFLLRLLRTSMILHASPACRENLEKRIGAQLDEAVLEDLLIPNMGYSVETLYDIDCVQRIVDYFLLMDQDGTEATSNCIAEEGQLMGGSHSLTPMTLVANLVDGYLAEVAPDTNLKLAKFQSLAAGIPEYARTLDDGIYCAIDIFLKAHPWLTESEKEQVCRLMNCQKLSLEASTHAAQNERLPLRVIVQVLFFEQLRLRTSVAGWFFVSENLENQQNSSEDLRLSRSNVPIQLMASRDRAVSADSMRDRVSELEKECLSMKQELEKLVRAKGGWNILCKRFGFRMKMRSCDPKPPPNPHNFRAPKSKETQYGNGKQMHGNGQLRN